MLCHIIGTDDRRGRLQADFESVVSSKSIYCNWVIKSQLFANSLKHFIEYKLNFFTLEDSLLPSSFKCYFSMPVDVDHVTTWLAFESYPSYIIAVCPFHRYNTFVLHAHRAKPTSISVVWIVLRPVLLHLLPYSPLFRLSGWHWRLNITCYREIAILFLRSSLLKILTYCYRLRFDTYVLLTLLLLLYHISLRFTQIKGAVFWNELSLFLTEKVLLKAILMCKSQPVTVIAMQHCITIDKH